MKKFKVPNSKSQIPRNTTSAVPWNLGLGTWRLGLGAWGLVLGTWFLGLGILGCRKEGPGGKAAIHGLVKRNSTLIPGAVVYIKYNAKESPGTNITYYDANVNADAKAYYEFVDLKKGDYYLFSLGFDSSSVQPVNGGIPVEIKSKTGTVEADVPVTE